jgi:hypothetical protein
MALLPKVKLKAVVNFPTAVYGGEGIAVRRENGQFFIDQAYEDFAPPVGGLLPADVPDLNALLWNDAKDEYVLSPISLPGGGGTGLPPGETQGYHLQTNGVGSFATWAAFLQSGMGAVFRTWQNKARDTIHARDFGVAADGLTDDTDAMNAPLAAAAGKKLILPPRSALTR